MADNIVYVNFEEGAKRVMNNAKFYVKMLGKFLDTKIDDLETAMTNGDMAKAQVAVHSLKGVAGNLSLTELYKQTVELEAQVKANSVKPDQFSVVKNTFTQTIEEVKKVIAQNA